ncbi:MAG: aminomethyl-transferring glycine dehydrogenase subunit GcvPB [Chloroflexi bacterium]|nr:aminomethyl-transferring glycine dehydrogenase subunit GcvPB [Chloroflexota bacterium]MCL5075326.1 aminomethyl-transferring glycine dehydrogenase subunit GcvPB [Chloroflexota bacterium]
MAEPLIFELSRAGRTSFSLPEVDVPEVPLAELLPKNSLRAELELPEISEVDLVRHFTRLSQLNHAVDTGFYPLGSCTMKYNPKIAEDVARLDGFTQIHPYEPEEVVQGALQLIYELQELLAEISGMDAVSLQPAAGAHGELTGMLIIRAYHQARGDRKRCRVLVPDSAHGTNPATAAMCGYEVAPVPSDGRGGVDLGALRSLAGSDLAALMLTIPNTLGLFDENILLITDIVHEAGGLVYCDGANMNAMLGRAKFGAMGCDVMHFNLHKTFGTPHGGGGPGSGPIAVKGTLASFLPVPIISRRPRGTTEDDWEYYLDYDRPLSIGKVKSFYGNFGVMVKAYTYIRLLGAEGLCQVSGDAVLNANYLMHKLKGAYDLPYDRRCMHEFVLSARRQKTQHGVRALDIAKRLMDYGYHPPTIYFPLIVEEALMIEPTETESQETLDAFATAMLEIAAESGRDPQSVQMAPHKTRFTRFDEVAAARKPDLRWRPDC